MSEEFSLNYHAATIQHLGIGLYKQLPQAIAELISNSWDADSHNVQISIDYKKKIIIVSDDGNGMSAKELNENFLTIARNRRLSDVENKETKEYGLSKLGRKVTGKKGLGKLALFGIADTIIIDSIQNGKQNSFELNYKKIQNSSETTYHPKTLLYNNDTSEKNGTKITIKDVTLKNITKLDTLYDSLSKRFNKYSREDFLVTLTSNDGTTFTLDEKAFIKSIRPKKEETEFTFNFPEDFSNIKSSQSRNVIQILKKYGITGVVFTKKTPLAANKQGFSVLSRGKLASEQSTTQFDNRSNDYFYTYAVGYFNIDYLDDDNFKDFISTDRQSIRWEADEELLNIKSNLNKLIGIIQREWKQKRKKARDVKAKNTIKRNHIITQTNLSVEDSKVINNISEKLEDDNITISDSDKQKILDTVTKSTQSYKKDHSVYKELIPKNFTVPSYVGTKIKMLRAEMLEAAEEKEVNRFILTQGLLLRAMIESTTTIYLRKNFQEATDIIKEKNYNCKLPKDESEIDTLAFAIKYKIMVQLLSKHGKINNRRVSSLIDEFENNKVNKHLDLLMHDAENFPQFDTLKTIWNCVSPQLMYAFDDMNN